MNSSIYSQPVHPIEDCERDLATFNDAIKTAKPRPNVKPEMFPTWQSAAVFSGALFLVFLFGAWVAS